MPFPDSPRVIYDLNPLVDVFCQVRFPAILRIDSELPTRYQEALRELYPIFTEGPAQQQIKLDLSPQLAGLIGGGGPLSFRGRANYEFISLDKSLKVHLNRESLTLVSSRYRRWEEFKDQFRAALDPFLEEYSPPFFTRVGLRYRDVVQRGALGLGDVEWRELLQPHIAGELSSPDIAQDVVQYVGQTTIRLQDQAQVLINHGLASNQNNEDCYLIDSDFSTEQKTEINDVIQSLDHFNQHARRLFRWCITNRLHDAMRPQELH